MGGERDGELGVQEAGAAGGEPATAVVFHAARMSRGHPDAPNMTGWANGPGWEIDVHSDYAFWVKGRLTPALKVALEPLEATDSSAETLLVAPVVDRAMLHGLIARIQALGLELVELRQLPPVSAGGGDERPTCGCGRGADERGPTGNASRSRT